jgi:hypothetical protein
MAKDQTYPGASLVQWFARAFKGSAMDANCGCLHTTETIGWPGYGGGATAPNMTSMPDFKNKRLVDRAHFPVDMSSRALRNLTGGVETNTLNVFQWELVATCDPAHAKTWKQGSTTYKAGVDYIYTPTAPDWWLKAVAERLVWLEKEHGIPATTPVKGVWTAYPKSYANGGGQRFSNARWRALTGWCGHQHVPENVHGDPGAINFPRILEHVKALKAPVVPVIPNRGTVVLSHFEAGATRHYWRMGDVMEEVSLARRGALRRRGVTVTSALVAPTDPVAKLPRINY